MDAALLAELEVAIGRLLLRSNRVSLVEAALAHAPDGLDAGTYPVLSGVARIGPARTTALAAEIGVDRSVASRQADRLIAAGLLDRLVDADDARISLLALTGPGRRAMTRSRRDLTRELGRRLDGASDRQLRAGLDVLTRLVTDEGDR